jgi:hypothetical protein
MFSFSINQQKYISSYTNYVANYLVLMIWKGAVIDQLTNSNNMHLEPMPSEKRHGHKKISFFDRVCFRSKFRKICRLAGGWTDELPGGSKEGGWADGCLGVLA